MAWRRWTGSLRFTYRLILTIVGLSCDEGFICWLHEIKVMLSSIIFEGLFIFHDSRDITTFINFLFGSAVYNI